MRILGILQQQDISCTPLWPVLLGFALERSYQLEKITPGLRGHTGLLLASDCRVFGHAYQSKEFHVLHLTQYFDDAQKAAVGPVELKTFLSCLYNTCRTPSLQAQELSLLH